MHRLKKRVAIIRMGGDAFEDTHPAIMQQKVKRWIQNVKSKPDVKRYMTYHADLQGLLDAANEGKFLKPKDYKKFTLN